MSKKEHQRKLIHLVGLGALLLAEQAYRELEHKQKNK